MRKDRNRKLLSFIAESGMLKRVNRSGWSVLGITDSESVADHSFRCAVIGYVLAFMEKASPYRILLMTLFNDIHESRIGDLHKMAQKYVDIEGPEQEAFCRQIDLLPEPLSKELASIRDEYIKQETIESVIARDSDILECLIQAKEYYEHGFLQAEKFMKKAPAFLKTGSAKTLWAQALKMNLSDWWNGLTEFKR